MAVFAAFLGAALLFDAYLEKNNIAIDDIQTESGESSREMGAIHFVSQANVVSIKSSVDKPVRKIKVNSSDKHIQKYHQFRKYQVFNAGLKVRPAPQVLSYHYLGFKNYHITLADDDEPHIS